MKDLKEEADKKNISIRPYNVIYKLIDDVKKEINTKLPPLDTEEVIGTREALIIRPAKFVVINLF